MAYSKDRANRARWSRDQREKAGAEMARQFEQDRDERLEGLRQQLAVCEVNSEFDALFGASVRDQIARLEPAS